MSNRITLTRTKFVDLKSGDENFGYRIYDNYAQAYSMFSDSIKPSEDDKEFLSQVNNGCPDQVTEMIDWAVEHGMYIDDIWFDGKEVVSMLNSE